MQATTKTEQLTPLDRARLSLDGLSVGDAFGQCFFAVTPSVMESRLAERHIPPPPWFYTDDTVMAGSIYQCLSQHQRIDGDWLAKDFAQAYHNEPDRGYGGTARVILRAINNGTPWLEAARAAFDGEGSCGNGGAMRAAPIGAYFADDLSQVVSQARLSAAVTHAHPDGQTGAIAVALAAAWMTTQYDSSKPCSHQLIEFVLAHLPQTETYWRIKKALSVPLQVRPQTAALILGNGAQVVSSDTVPFCLWCVAKHPQNFEDALWSAVIAFGDMDTNCAIVGSLVALACGRKGIPEEWLESREALRVA